LFGRVGEAEGDKAGTGRRPADPGDAADVLSITERECAATADAAVRTQWSTSPAALPEVVKGVAAGAMDLARKCSMTAEPRSRNWPVFWLPTIGSAQAVSRPV